MLRLSLLVDHALVLLAHVATRSPAPGAAVMTARALAAASGLPEPTVSKVLKRLSRAALLQSRRGHSGGYSLARPASAISVADVLHALEGPVALTRCTQAPTRRRLPPCALLASCPTKGAWGAINRQVTSTLQNLTLMDVGATRLAASTAPQPRFG